MKRFVCMSSTAFAGRNIVYPIGSFEVKGYVFQLFHYSEIATRVSYLWQLYPLSKLWLRTVLIHTILFHTMLFHTMKTQKSKKYYMLLLISGW